MSSDTLITKNGLEPASITLSEGLKKVELALQKSTQILSRVISCFIKLMFILINRRDLFSFPFLNVTEFYTQKS
jgi:hypothetical protein